MSRFTRAAYTLRQTAGNGRSGATLTMTSTIVATITATALYGVVAGSPIHAEGRNGKKSIYDEPVDTGVPQERPPSRLEQLMSEARDQATQLSHEVSSHSRGVVDAIIDAEKQVEDTVRKVHQPEEPMMPNLLYIGLAGLAGSILATRRGILARVCWPPLLAVAASYYLMPATTRSAFGLLRDTADKPEVRDTVRRHAPAVLDSSDRAREAVSQSVERAGSMRRSVEDKLSDQVARARHEVGSLEHRVRSSLGGAAHDIDDLSHLASENAVEMANSARRQADQITGWLRDRTDTLYKSTPVSGHEAHDVVKEAAEKLGEELQEAAEKAKEHGQAVIDKASDALEESNSKVTKAVEEAKESLTEGRNKLVKAAEKAEHSLRSDENRRRPS